jgi:hypothetical protein
MAILLGKEVKVLSDTAVVNSLSATPVSAYQAPPANAVVITKVVLRCITSVGFTNPPTVKVEINPGAGDIFPAEELTGVLSVNDTWTFNAEAKSLVVPAGGTVDITVTSTGAGTSQTLRAEVIGYVVF